jgi:hypothetical protein
MWPPRCAAPGRGQASGGVLNFLQQQEARAFGDLPYAARPEHKRCLVTARIIVDASLDANESDRTQALTLQHLTDPEGAQGPLLLCQRSTIPGSGGDHQLGVSIEMATGCGDDNASGLIYVIPEAELVWDGPAGVVFWEAQRTRLQKLVDLSHGRAPVLVVINDTMMRRVCQARCRATGRYPQDRVLLAELLGLATDEAINEYGSHRYGLFQWAALLADEDVSNLGEGLAWLGERLYVGQHLTRFTLTGAIQQVLEHEPWVGVGSTKAWDLHRAIEGVNSALDYVRGDFAEAARWKHHYQRVWAWADEAGRVQGGVHVDNAPNLPPGLRADFNERRRLEVLDDAISKLRLPNLDFLQALGDRPTTDGLRVLFQVSGLGPSPFWLIHRLTIRRFPA